jgi:protein-tyrosine phosphatase
MEHECHIVIDGASNLRDLGWFCSPHRRMTTRRLFRSGNLDRLSAGGLGALAQLGVAVVIDLRGTEEAAGAPQIEGTTRVHLPIEPTVVAELLARLEAGTLTVEGAIGVMQSTYRWYVVEHAATYAELLHHLLTARRRPVLFHCAAGKDRTGVAAALVLTALGVTQDVIMEDYLLSNRLYRPHVLGTSRIPEDVREAIVKVRPSYLEAAFAAMREGWGEPARYLEKALGFGAREREVLREALT